MLSYQWFLWYNKHKETPRHGNVWGLTNNFKGAVDKLNCNTSEAKTKVCSKCKMTKSHTVELFIVDKRNPSGLGALCRECKREMSRKSREDRGSVRRTVWTIGKVRKYVKDINMSVLSTIESDSVIISPLEKLEFICLCGDKYERTFTKFRNFGRHKCIKCANAEGFDKQRKTRAEFVEELRQARGDEFELVGEYINYHEVTGIKHSLCGRMFDSCASRMLSQNGGCPLCRDDNRWRYRQKTHDAFLAEFKNCMGEDYELLSDYTGCDDKIRVRHSECGEVYISTPGSVLQGIRCTYPECLAKRIREATTLTHKEYINSFKDPLEKDYVILGEYENSETHIEVAHKKCGSRWFVSPSRFRSGSRCPRCRESKGERVISQYLDLAILNYIPQYRTEECKDVRALPFDFAVLDDNDSISLMIEFDGEQHFESIDFFGGEANLMNVQRRDKIKSKYCLENNIPLLRIPYWDFDNIERILGEAIKEGLQVTQ